MTSGTAGGNSRKADLWQADLAEAIFPDSDLTVADFRGAVGYKA